MPTSSPSVSDDLKIMLAEAASRNSLAEAATVIAGTLDAIAEDHRELRDVAEDWHRLLSQSIEWVEPIPSAYEVA